MKTGDWIPTREQDLDDLLVKWDECLSNSAKRTKYGWDTPTCADLILQIGDYQNAREEYKADDSSAHLIVKNNKKEIVIAAMRRFASSSIRFNPRMTEEEKLDLGVQERDSHNTPQPTPTDHVEFSLRLDVQSHTVWVDYHIAGSKSHSKGRYHGVEVRYWVLPLDAPPLVTAEDPSWRSEVDTSTPWSHTFTTPEIGQRVYIVLRWENSSVGTDQAAGKGPWSLIQSIVIA
jgi:hypothetical protein